MKPCPDPPEEPSEAVPLVFRLDRINPAAEQETRLVHDGATDVSMIGKAAHYG